MNLMHTRFLTASAALLVASCATFGPDERALTEFDGRLKAFAFYDYGADRAPMAALTAFLTEHRSAADRRAIEPRLLAFAQSTTSTRAARQHVIREIGRVGSAAAAPALIALLSDAELGDDAAMALETLAEPKADAAVLQALPTLPAAARGRVVALLGRRRAAGAVPAIVPFLKDADSSLSAAAVAALGGCATSDAAAGLIAAMPSLKGHALTASWDALLSCHAAALDAGNANTANAILLALEKNRAPTHVRMAATLATLQTASPQEAALKAAGLLTSSDPDAWTAGAHLARHRTDDRSLLAVIAALPSMPPASQVAVLGIVEDRRLSVAAPLLARLSGSPDPAVRAAALRAMGPAGRAESVPVLAAAAAEGAEEGRAGARKALRLVHGTGVDEAILGTLRTGTPVVRIELIRAMGDRGMTAGLPVLLAAAGDADAAIRTEAIRQVGALAGPKEWAQLLDLIASTANESDRPAVVAAAATAAARQPTAGADLALRLQAASPPAVHAALLSLAGRVASDATLPDLVRAATSADASTRDAALRALGAWPRSTALPALLDAAAGTNPQAQRLAARGAMEVTRKATDLNDAARIARYRDLVTKLGHDDDRRMLLSAAGALAGPDALALVAGFLDQPPVRAEAEAAAIQIAKRSGKPDAATAAVLQRIAAESTSPTRKDEAAALLK